MQDIRRWIIEVWDTFPNAKTGKTGLCSRLVWASPEDEQQRLLTLREVLLRWQLQFN